jgi:hypothetical protein
MIAICPGQISRMSAAASTTCGLITPAFCDTFDEGPSAVRGRAGDLNPARWGVGHLAPQDFSGFGPVANPAPPAPIPPCRASYNVSSVYPPNDTLICDPSGTRSAQLMTAVSVQNYGLNSYLIRQPFDFAGRVGKIAFDVDAVSVSGLAGFVSIDITKDPVPAPTFHESLNFEHGPVPANALMIKWSDNCQSAGAAITIGSVMVYTNYLPTIVTPSFVAGQGTPLGCAKTRQAFLNHFEIQLSSQHLDIYGSDYSPDEGQTFPNFRRLYSADLSVPFTRGYVHVTARNHATKKYGYGPDWVYHWDNIGFDGPVLPNPRSYEIADNTTTAIYPAGSGTTIVNLGYQLLDGTSGKPAGIYDPIRIVGPLQFSGVNLSAVTAATLTLSASFNSISHQANTTWGLKFRFNGGIWRTRLLTTQEVQAMSQLDAEGNVAFALDVPVADLHDGANTLELLTVNAPMDLPPTVANLDLVLSFTGPAAPTNLHIIK